MDSLLEELRSKTASIHHALHDHPILRACQEERMSLDEYTHMLKAFYAPWKKLIPSIEKVPIPELRTSLKRRAKALQSDLRDLNVEEDFFNQKDVIPYQNDELLGMCYVVVGSSLGATQLSKNVSASLIDAPNTYLSISPKDAGWSILVDQLRQFDVSEYPKTGYSAQNMFQMIQLELSKSIV